MFWLFKDSLTCIRERSFDNSWCAGKEDFFRRRLFSLHEISKIDLYFCVVVTYIFLLMLAWYILAYNKSWKQIFFQYILTFFPAYFCLKVWIFTPSPPIKHFHDPPHPTKKINKTKMQWLLPIVTLSLSVVFFIIGRLNAWDDCSLGRIELIPAACRPSLALVLKSSATCKI